MRPTVPHTPGGPGASASVGGLTQNGPVTDDSGLAKTGQAELRPGDAALVERSLVLLGRRRPLHVVTKLAGGGSGSQVFLLELDSERVVLKVTEDPSWRQRAGHELRVYRDFASTLHDFLPSIRAAYEDRAAVRLLLAEYDPCPPASALTPDTWVELGDQLGQLHRAAGPRPAWLTPRRWPSAEEVAQALHRWDNHGSGALARRAAADLAGVRDLHLSLPTVLTHGDCHLGNLLRGPTGRILWIDWQEVCLSTGLDDLVFLWQRAEFDGARPPREAMTSAYVHARRLGPDGDFRAVLAASELRLLLVAWPSYLSYGSKDRQQILTRRLEQLVDEGP